MLERDRQRLTECRDRVNVCPLGCGALAGTTLPLDREMVARLLGFVDGRGKPRLALNSMDAVSDRDFVAGGHRVEHFDRYAIDAQLSSCGKRNTRDGYVVERVQMNGLFNN